MLQGDQSVWWLGRMDRAPCSCHRLRERRVLRRGVAVAGHNVLLCRVSQVRILLCNLPNDRSVAKNERPYRRGSLDPAHRLLRLPAPAAVSSWRSDRWERRRQTAGATLRVAKAYECLRGSLSWSSFSRIGGVRRC